MNWIIPITGFTETHGRRTGIGRLWWDLRHLSSPQNIVVTPRGWDDDMREFADFVLQEDRSPRVMLVGYSWGAGVGAMEFAQAAWERDLRVQIAVLADPVYRSPFLPKFLPFNPRSVSPWLRPKIEVPASVERVEWVRQQVDLPRGHDLVAASAEDTKISEPTLVHASHGRIDESVTFRELVMHEAEQFADATLPWNADVRCAGIEFPKQS